ncbi:MAG: YbjQ family protein [Pseudomonadota bacterium]
MIELGVFVVLLGCGYFFGRAAENRHFASIRRREEELRDVLVFNGRELPPEAVGGGMLVTGSVVISVDYFKRVLAGLRGIFGGRITSYESLLERARREALLRMKDEAARLGAGCVVNARVETSSISQGRGDSIGSVEVLAFGTAVGLSSVAGAATDAAAGGA